MSSSQQSALSIQPGSYVESTSALMNGRHFLDGDWGLR
jgi:hypothetical protein